ncbi:hypothetical protein T265_12190 [Opisthorchis viverrini]|uniref:PAN domain protein n=1 Tax=Opisthorchis viverrini TaxID=6198 RepID=A0A074Z638_OPIVI|nr:hypothetical protein T265_12190 [Opisthorchis viverrini]KER18690.1 hypothetical protein T265_12190 [Opisthorchis viverrini]
MFFPQILSIFLHASLSLSSNCPANFKLHIAQVCLVQRPGTKGFCNAVQSCADYGKQRNQLVFLIGRNAPLLAFIVQPLKPVYTGLNCLLETQVDKDTVWRDLDPRSPEYSIPSTSIIWSENHPRGNRPFLLWSPREITMQDFAEEDYPQSLQVYCEYGGPIPCGDRQIRFRSDFPLTLPELVQANFHFVGCPYITTTHTKLDCARGCALDSACRSIYYDHITGKCVQMMHADSLLPKLVGTGGNVWSRFAKVSVNSVTN